MIERASHAVLVAAALAASGAGGVADASPLVRFGLTTGVNANTSEGAEAGVMLASGARAGRFVGEINYSYLSFLDPDTSIHRLGVALRADLAVWGTARYWKTLFGEVGAGKRWGAWRVGDAILPSDREQNEVHVGVGLQLDKKWQVALRVGMARRDPMLGTSCRASGVICAMTVMPASSGLAESLMLEWLFVLDR